MDAPLQSSVLAILCGSNRGGAATWRMFHRNVLHPNRADLMLVVAQPWVHAMRQASSPRDAFYDGKRLLLDRAVHVVTVPEFANWAEALDLMEAHARKAHEPDGLLTLPSWRERLRSIPCPSESLGGLRNISCVGGEDAHKAAVAGSAAIVHIYRWYAKRALVQHRLLQRYAWFVYARTDTYVLCVQVAAGVGHLLVEEEAPPTARASRVLTPSGREADTCLIPSGAPAREGRFDNDWGGVYDRFAVCSSGGMLTYLSSTIERWIVHNRSFARPGLPTNAEGMLASGLAEARLHVERIPRCVFVTQSTTDLDNGDISHWRRCALANWSSPPLLSAQGLCPKYCDEFEGALRTCEAEHAVANASRWQCADVLGDDSTEDGSLDALLLSKKAARLYAMLNRGSWGAAGRGDGEHSRRRGARVWMAFGMAGSVAAWFFASTDCALWVRRSWHLSKQRRAREIHEGLLRRPRRRMDRQHLSL